MLAAGSILHAEGGLYIKPSWAAHSQDGRYRLVMLSDHAFFEPSLTKQEAKAYKESGVYERRPDGDHLLWSVSYYQPFYDVYFSSDGKHVLLALTGASRKYAETDHPFQFGPGVLCLHQDRRPDYHQMRDFVSGGLANEVLGHLIGRSPPITRTSYDPAREEYRFTNSFDEECVLDLASGSIAIKQTPWGPAAACFLVLTPLMTLLALRGARPSTPAADKPELPRISLLDLFLCTSLVASLAALWSLSATLAMELIVAALLGGSIAQLHAPTSRSLLVGSLTSAYGCVVGLMAFSFATPAAYRESFVLWIYLAVGFTVGSFYGGWIAQRVAQAYSAPPPGEPAT